MKHLRLGTRITLWSAVVVTVAIVLCGTVGTLYVLRKERNELDQQLREEAEHFFQEWRHQGGPRFDWKANASEVDEWMATGTTTRIIAVEDTHGGILYQSPSLPANFRAVHPPGFHSISAGDVAWRVGVFGSDGMVLRLGGDMEEGNDLAEDLATTFLLSLPIVLAFVIFGARLISYKALAPIQEITAVAEQITAEDLGQRIPLPPVQDEMHRLSTVLNATFDRLEHSFQQATRFSADASHELKTPLTVLRSSIETMLYSGRHDEETQQDLAGLLEETRRLSAITESLLLLSRADAGKLQLDLRPGDLAEVIRLCAGDATILFEAEQIQLDLQLPAAAPALLDRTRLSQILMNLLDNAGKYNLPHGQVRVELVEKEGAWEIGVANTGPGIPSAHIPRLFTRFFRGEHSGEKAGQGLGLSLSRELARAHHGDLVLAESEAGWTRFVFTLPKL